MQRLFIYIVIVGHVVSVFPQEAKDSLLEAEEGRQLADYILPASLVTVGAVGVYSDWFKHINHAVRNDIKDIRSKKFEADNYIQYLPVVSNLCLGALGVKGRNTIEERLLTTSTAYLTMGLLINGMKMTFREPRPDTGRRNSMPSGHTATAFMGAELVRLEYGWEWGIAAYSAAASVAFLRLYNDRHWLTDVIAGAGIGIIATRIAYALLPWECKLFSIKNNRQFGLLPTYDVNNHRFDVSCFVHL